MLHDVHHASAGSIPDFAKNPDSEKAKSESLFRWKAKSVVKYGLSKPPPSEKMDGVNKFKNIIEQACQNGHTLAVVYSHCKQIHQVYWPFFAAMPSPAPPSYFPWVGLENENPAPGEEGWKEIMEFAPNRSFELDPEYVKVALGVRPKKFNSAGGVASTVAPSDYKIFQLPQTVKFQDLRHYLAVVLGSFAYEAERARSDVGNFYNGEHKCEVWSAEGNTQGTRKYLLLLNIRPRRNIDTGVDAAIPQANERVLVRIRFGDIDQSWTGHVIEIPASHLKYGRNVAIVAHSSPTTPEKGRILDNRRVVADFYFGHQGQNTSRTKENIIGLMTGHIPDKKSDFRAAYLKEILLSQNLHNTLSDTRNLNSSAGTLPFKKADDLRSKVGEVCNEMKLSREQTEIVQHYFTHRLTLVRGPGGTGKSTLINAIIRLEEQFNQAHWICTDSNEACDVLVRKTCARHGNLQPPKTVRVRPMFEEKLDYTVTQSMFKPDGLLEPSPSRKGTETIEQAIQRLLANQDVSQKAMSLENLIKVRLQLWLTQGLAKPLWPKEADDYTKLAEAAKAFEELKFEGMTEQAYAERQQTLERKYRNQLQRIQSNHVSASLGVYSTTAAATGPLLRGFVPRGVIMDEASQAIEANAVGAIIHSIKQGSLHRVLLIGDDQQLPPTVLSEKNPFRSTAAISLFERLIKAGHRPHQISTQYRSEASISSILQNAIYRPIGLDLKNGDRSEAQRRQDAEFRKFIRKLAKDTAKMDLGETNAVIISPEEPRGNGAISWKALRLRGSTSRFNLTTARIVVRLVYELVNANYSASSILCIAFYKDQVQLLESIFKKSDKLRGIKISTVDGAQGSERPIVIVDAVVLGAANGKHNQSFRHVYLSKLLILATGDGMGFLQSEKRRFCVAMGRAQHGRIVIASKDMVVKQNDPNVWSRLLAETVSRKGIIPGGPFNQDIPAQQLNGFMKESFEAFLLAAKEEQPARRNTNRSANPPPPAHEYNAMAFQQATGATEEKTKFYLNKYPDLHIAIDKYLQEHGDDEIEVEEIGGSSQALVIRPGPSRQ